MRRYMAYEAAKEEAEDRAEKAEQKVFPLILHSFLRKEGENIVQGATEKRVYWKLSPPNCDQTIFVKLLPNFLRHQPQQ